MKFEEDWGLFGDRGEIPVTSWYYYLIKR